MPALYRKYRPQRFADVVGQSHIKVTLQHELERESIAHAYLLCGPRGLGKTTLARLFAKSLNCQQRVAGESEPCNECTSCQEIAAQRSIDVIEIDAASQTGIDNVRSNIIENSRVVPVSSKYKIFIIDEVHMLSTASFNALLKTMEEPPSHVVFILCTTETHKVPDTIISRCQRFDFKKIPSDQMFERLLSLVGQEGKRVDEAVLRDIIRLSDGCLRDAESLLGKLLTLGDDITTEQASLVLPHTDMSAVCDLFTAIAEHNAVAAIELVNKLIENGVALEPLTETAIEYARHLLIAKSGVQLIALGIDHDELTSTTAQRLVEQLSHDRLLALLSGLLDVRDQMRQTPIAQLPLEMMIVTLTQHPAARPAERAMPPAPVPVPPPAAPIAAPAPAPSAPPMPVEPASAPVATPPEPPVNTSPSAAADGPGPDLTEVEAQWPAITDRLLKSNYTLASMLRLSRPIATSGAMIDVALKSGFYRDRLNDNANKQLVEDIMSDILGQAVVVRGVVDTAVEPLITEPLIMPPSEEAPAPYVPAGASSASESAPSPYRNSTRVSPPTPAEATSVPIAVTPPPKAADAMQDVMGMF